MEGVERVHLDAKTDKKTNKPNQNRRKQKPQFRKQGNRQQSRQQNRPNQRGGFKRQQQFRQRPQRKFSQQQQQPRRQQQQRKFLKTGKKREEGQVQTQVFYHEPKPNVILRGLGNVNDEMLRGTCHKFGPQDMCKMVRDNFGNIKPLGIGLVRFEKWEDAKRCVEEYHGAGVINESNDKTGYISAKLIKDTDNDWYKYLTDNVVHIQNLKIRKDKQPRQQNQRRYR